MPLNLRQSKKQRGFDLSVSYRIGETNEKLRDALNVFSNQGRLDTRFGRSVFNSTTLGGSVLSLSFFKSAAGTRYLLAKVGATLYKVAASGAHTVVKTGLSATTKHRTISWARGSSSRQIISIEEDGLFQYNGTTFGPLGQAVPVAPGLATASGSLVNGTYKAYLTFYSSTTGFESNASVGSTGITTSAQGVSLSAIPITATNPTIDKVNIYLWNTASVGAPVYAGQVALGVTTFDIATNPTSTATFPLTGGAPLTGGGRYLTEFNRKLVYTGNDTFRSDVFFSEEDLPDAFNDGTGPNRLVLSPIYDGRTTGIATGLYNNTVLDPYLVIFKKRSTHVYSEIGGIGKLVPISAEIGCVSDKTISVKNGNVHFLSHNGWRVIENGRIMVNKFGNAATLGNNDLDDVFANPGYIYEINRAQLEGCFSVYYSTLDQYMTWIAEGSSNDFAKTYVYEFKLGGFKPYAFNTPSTCACIGEDSNGHEVVYMADANGRVYSHSTAEDQVDDDSTGTDQAITAFAVMSWLDGDDLDASFNFRELILRRVAGAGDLMVRAWVNYSLDNVGEEYILSNTQTGFSLDISSLDIDSFGSDERTIKTARADLNRSGENILIGFYQNEIGKSIGLVSAQIDFNKNGNRN